jgi:hypothetical protein
VVLVVSKVSINKNEKFPYDTPLLAKHPIHNTKLNIFLFGINLCDPIEIKLNQSRVSCSAR